LKRPAASKRAAPPRASDGTREFYKDWARLAQSGRYDLTRLKAVMLLLIANDEPLGPQWRDHALLGNWDGHRECHIGGDFLLIYRLDESGKAGAVIFVRAGTHAELFQ
jgi:mRNA interferase YafQ